MDVPLTVKQQAVSAYMKGGNAARIGARFGYGPFTVLGWVRAYQHGDFSLETFDPEVTRPSGTVTAEHAAVVTVAAREIWPNARAMALPQKAEEGMLDRALAKRLAIIEREHRELGLAPPRMP